MFQIKKTMKKLLLFLCIYFLLNNAFAQQTPNEPLYLMFDTNLTLNTAKMRKYIDSKQSNDGFKTFFYQDIFKFTPKSVDGMANHSYSYLYGGGFLGLITIDKNNPVVLNQAQLANYNIKTHDELAEYFRLTPIKIKDQKQYFWEREVYIIEKVYGKNNLVWYHKYRVEPDILNN
jgi:hypothetical protein